MSDETINDDVEPAASQGLGSERPDAGEQAEQLSGRLQDGGTPGQVGAVDGTAAAGSAGAVAADPGADDDNAVVPTHAPDPGTGPD